MGYFGCGFGIWIEKGNLSRGRGFFILDMQKSLLNMRHNVLMVRYRVRERRGRIMGGREI